MDRPDPKAGLKAEIREIFEDSGLTYGYRRVHLELGNRGRAVSQNQVQRLMQDMGLKAIVRARRGGYRSFRGKVGVIAPNRLKRCFTPERPNQAWVSDVTQFRVAGTTVYLSPIMDLCDRSIIDYAIGTSPTVDFVTAPLKRALYWLREGERPMVHTDQGFQYQNVEWRKALKGRATQSMSRKGNCYDNAVMENFFGHLKEDILHHRDKPFRTVTELIKAIRDYIPWYNTHRIQTILGGLTPAQRREQAAAA